MKILFSALHLGHFRNFESAIRELASRGHAVHLAGDETEEMGGEGLAWRLASDYPGRITWDQPPSLDAEPWHDAARRMRVSLDYVRALDPRYPEKLRTRAEERTARVVRWAVRLPGGRLAALAALKRFERLMPASAETIHYLRRIAPDVVALASLTYSRSQQLDMLKAARALRIPVAAAIMSWDHLSSKALLHVVPDRVIVWNEFQKREAVEMHGIPPSRIVLTGAQCYDQWFTQTPIRSRDAFCHTVRLRADRPFVLWVHSALSPTPEPPEPVLVRRWIEALRGSPDPRLRELGVLVRPHPERLKEWAGISLDAYENVTFHGRNPIDRDAKDDYFDSLYYSSAVVGLVTTAFLEAAIVGRPVLSFTLPEYRMHQEEMIHFRYLTDVEGGLLQLAPDLDAHFVQLRAALTSGSGRDDRNWRFLRAFVRPAGLDAPVTPVFANALERLYQQGTKPDPSLERGAWLSPFVLPAASRSRAGLGRWLMNDPRTDAHDEHNAQTNRSLQVRRAAKKARINEKVRRNERRQRRNALIRRQKAVKNALRRLRHSAAVNVYRGLYIVGLWRGELPGTGGKD